MSSKMWKVLVISLTSTLFLTGVVLAMSSTNYAINWNVVSGGGGSGSSDNYVARTALVQTAIGASASDNYRSGSGYWYKDKPVELPPPLRIGDVSGDGVVNEHDASLILRHIVGQITLSNAQLEAANVSAQSDVTAYDAALIFQFTAGLIDRFPAEEN